MESLIYIVSVEQYFGIMQQCNNLELEIYGQAKETMRHIEYVLFLAFSKKRSCFLRWHLCKT